MIYAVGVTWLTSYGVITERASHFSYLIAIFHLAFGNTLGILEFGCKDLILNHAYPNSKVANRDVEKENIIIHHKTLVVYYCFSDTFPELYMEELTTCTWIISSTT